MDCNIASNCNQIMLTRLSANINILSWLDLNVNHEVMSNTIIKEMESLKKSNIHVLA